jgi:hypothetical protein
MADLNKQILIKLTIDNKEVQAALQLDDALLDKVAKKVNEFNRNAANTGSAGKQAASGTSAMNQALGQFGFVLGDADMFLMNFQMGMRSIANNIPMVVQGFIYANTEAQRLGTTVKSQLISSLAGPGGLLVSINALMFLLNVLPTLLSNVNDEAGKAATDGLPAFAEQLKQMTSEQISSKLEDIKDKLKDINDEYQKIVDRQAENPNIVTSTGTLVVPLTSGISTGAVTDQQTKLTEEQRKQLQQATEMRGKIQLEVDNYDKLLKQLPNSMSMMTDELKSQISLYVSDVTDLGKINQELVDLKASAEGRLKEIDKSTEQREKERAEVAKKVLAEKKKELEEQKKIIEQNIGFLGKAPIKGVRSLLFPDERLESTGFETTSQKVAEGKASFTMQLKDTEILYAKHMANLIRIGQEGQRELLQQWIDTINGIGNVINQLSQTYSMFYQNAQQAANKEVDEWQKKERKKLDTERDVALSHAKTTKERERINKEYDAREEALEEEAKKRRYEALSGWFEFQKRLAQAQIAIEMAKAIAVEWGKMGLFALVTQGLIIGALGAQLIAVQQQKMPGYAKGGAIVGENGPEIIAPFQDYASGQSKLIAMTMMTVRDEIRSGRASNYVSGGFSSDSSSIKNLENAVSRLNDRLDAGIYAYQDDRQAKKAYRAARKQNSRAKI